MSRRMNFRPDLAACVLEDRTLLDASQAGIPSMALTAGGYAVLPVPSANFSASLGTFAGVIGTAASSDISGMTMAAGFYITGFGLSGMTIGNGNGSSVPSPGGQAGTGRTHTVISSVGSPASADAPNSRGPANPFAQGALLLTKDTFFYIGKTFASGGVARSPVPPITPAGTPDQSGPATSGAAEDPRASNLPTPMSGRPAHSEIVRSVRETRTPGPGSSR
jgi:hypothetical protein